MGSAQRSAAVQPTKDRAAENEFARRKGDWLRRALLDPEISDAAFRLLAFVSDHAAIRDKGHTHFSQDTIAAQTGRCDRSVRNALVKAVSGGYLACRRRPGRTNEYWPIWDGPRKNSSDPPRKNIAGLLRKNPSAPPRKNSSGESGKKLPTTHLRDPSKVESSNPDSSPSSPDPAREAEEDFKRLNGKNGIVGTSFTITDPEDRIARFQQKIVANIGPEGWAIVMQAMTPKHPQHAEALRRCKRAATAIGKGWPRSWPMNLVHDPEAARKAHARFTSARRVDA